MSRALRDHLAELLGRLELAQAGGVTQCDVCGRPSDRLQCQACRAEAEAKWLEDAAERDRIAAAIIRRAKVDGRLSDADRRWLIGNGDSQWVHWLEQSFRAKQQGGKRAKDAGAGFDTDPGSKR